MMQPIPPADGARPARAFARSSTASGILRGRQVMQGAYLIDINAMVFGMPRALFPAIGLNVFHGGPTVVGYLFAAPGAGALVGALTTGWVSSIDRRGRAVIVSVVIWGLAITAFGFSHILRLGPGAPGGGRLGRRDLGGAPQHHPPDHGPRALPEPDHRRSSSRWSRAGPGSATSSPAGWPRSPATQFSVVSGGALCVVGAVALALAMPDFRAPSGERSAR